MDEKIPHETWADEVHYWISCPKENGNIQLTKQPHYCPICGTKLDVKEEKK